MNQTHSSQSAPNPLRAKSVSCEALFIAPPIKHKAASARMEARAVRDPDQPASMAHWPWQTPVETKAELGAGLNQCCPILKPRKASFRVLSSDSLKHKPISLTGAPLYVFSWRCLRRNTSEAIQPELLSDVAILPYATWSNEPTMPVDSI